MPESLRAAWRWWLAPAFLALALALYFTDPFIGDWDGLDYTVLSLRAEPSSMALGRTLFIYTNHALWRIAHALFGLPADKAYLLFKYVVVAQCPLAVIACWTLARDLTNNVRAATIAALLVAVSPILIIYSGQVMTDVPSVLLVTLALIMHLRGLRTGRVWLVLAGAALLGAGVNLRETVAFYGPWLVIAPFVCGWKFRLREIGWTILSCLIFALLAAIPFAILYWVDAHSYRAAWQGWRESMNAEIARHPVKLENLKPFLLYFFALSPMTMVSLPVAMWREWRANRLSVLLFLALCGLFANLLLFFNYSTVVNWRYFLTGLPALVPLTASYFLQEQTERLGTERRAFWAAVAGIIFTAIVCGIYLKPISTEHVKKRAETRDYRARLALLPEDAVVIAGGQTIAVNYWRGIGAGRWLTIGTGSGWPGDNLVPQIESYLREGRRVFLDAEPRWWSPCGWQRTETTALPALETRFRFRLIDRTIYELRPIDDPSAKDHPNLQRLLPENRPEDVRKCARGE